MKIKRTRTARSSAATAIHKGEAGSRTWSRKLFRGGESGAGICRSGLARAGPVGQWLAPAFGLRQREHFVKRRDLLTVLQYDTRRLLRSSEYEVIRYAGPPGPVELLDLVEFRRVHQAVHGERAMAAAAFHQIPRRDEQERLAAPRAASGRTPLARRARKSRPAAPTRPGSSSTTTGSTWDRGASRRPSPGKLRPRPARSAPSRTAIASTGKGRSCRARNRPGAAPTPGARILRPEGAGARPACQFLSRRRTAARRRPGAWTRPHSSRTCRRPPARGSP